MHPTPMHAFTQALSTLISKEKEANLPPRPKSRMPATPAHGKPGRFGVHQPPPLPHTRTSGATSRPWMRSISRMERPTLPTSHAIGFSLAQAPKGGRPLSASSDRLFSYLSRCSVWGRSSTVCRRCSHCGGKGGLLRGSRLRCI